MVPPLFLIFLVLGTIFIGVATPTEGGAMGATGSILLAMFKRWLDNDPRRFNLGLLRSAVEATAKLSAFVVFILVGARIFSLDVLRRERPRLGRAPADVVAGRPGRLPGVRQRPGVPARLLPRLLRARIHRDPAARTGGGEARHRPDLVRRHPRRQHADELHAPAVRLRSVLPALGRAEGALQGQGDRKA